ncbi:sodium/proton-translocating pyrophosphatase, partial [bacterium]|nr:sodium/proton-translocating pyrophosphatase [bacterium]
MALAAEAPAAAAAVESATPWTLWLAWGVGLVGSVVALYFALFFYKRVMAESEGDEKMVEIAEHVRAGAKAYLRRQYTTVAIVFVILFIVFSFMAFGLKVQALWVPFAFLTGGFFSGLCGFLGMRTATNASARTANGAKESLNKGLQVAFRSGAVMGLVVVGFNLLNICLWFLFLF